LNNGGYSGDGGPATSADLFGPGGLALDSSGNLYIADRYRVRIVDKTSGHISTFAGNGQPGYNGDDIPATSASLDTPVGIAVDTSDNLYIGDFYNHRVRMVTKSTGKIFTVAGNGGHGYSGDGGDATSATLSGPAGIAVNAAGDIYIAVSGNNVIRLVTKSDGKISTYAVSASLFMPWGVALDASDNLYIADTLHNRVLVVSKSTGTTLTVAGTGVGGYSGDGGSATSAELRSPSGIAVDADGNIYIADNDNHVVRLVTNSTGIITTYPYSDYDRGGAGSVTLAHDGTIYFSSNSYASVFAISPPSRPPTPYPSPSPSKPLITTNTTKNGTKHHRHSHSTGNKQQQQLRHVDVSVNVH
jgi:trimeric autotransporter adhesin